MARLPDITTDDEVAARIRARRGGALRPLVAATDAITRSVRLPEPLFEGLRGQLPGRQVFELITTVAAYNMVSRIVVALDITSPAARA
jgi:hypothetical protein